MQRFITVLGIMYMSLPLVVTQSFCDWKRNSLCPDGTRLILTPFIEEGNIDRGQALASVSLIGGENVRSFSGFFTVNKTYNSNIFFWFFPAEEDPENSPTILRITGIQGSSILGYGFSREIGPYTIDEKLQLKKRDVYWSQEYNVIYMDNPVGTGFSFTEYNLGYPKDDIQVGEQLYSAIHQFFQLFPDYRETEFFIAGESFGSKHVPALGYAIHSKNPTAKMKINLQGLAIASPWIDPKYQLRHSDYVYGIGRIDNPDKHEMKIRQILCAQFIKNKLYRESGVHCSRIFSLLLSTLNSGSVCTSLCHQDDSDMELVNSYLAQPSVRKSLGIGNTTLGYFGQYFEVGLLFKQLKSVAPWLAILMDNYRVLMYHGQDDTVTPCSLNSKMVRNLNWKGATDYARAQDQLWRIGGKIAGFFRTAGNFTEVGVRNAGHFVSLDQPYMEANLIERFIRNFPFDEDQY